MTTFLSRLKIYRRNASFNHHLFVTQILINHALGNSPTTFLSQIAFVKPKQINDKLRVLIHEYLCMN